MILQNTQPKPAPPSSDSKRIHPETQGFTVRDRREYIQDQYRGTHDESEHFEQLLTPMENLAQTNLTIATVEAFDTPSSNNQENQGAASSPSPKISTLWEAVLSRMDEQLETSVNAPVEALLELPNLGKIRVRTIPRGDTLEIILRFDRDDARQYCSRHRSSSAAWLSQQYGYPVHLTLLSETR